jgi:RNA polymerase sigma factor (sigma-70 family)
MVSSSNWNAVELLVRQARKGDQEAFRKLLEEHRGAVVSTLYACGVRCEETARDLAQDVAIRAWNKIGTLKEPRTFPTWVRRVAANAARDHLRRTAVRREDELDDALSLEGGDDPHERAERVAEVRLMMAALVETRSSESWWREPRVFREKRSRARWVSPWTLSKCGSCGRESGCGRGSKGYERENYCDLQSLR